MDNLETLSWWALVVTVPLLLGMAAIEWSEHKRWRALSGVIAALAVVVRLYAELQ